MNVGVAGAHIRRRHETRMRKERTSMNTHTRHWKRAALASALAMIAACGSDNPITDPGTSPQSAVRLKEIVIDRLPSPYYHFDYDGTGRITAASYSGGFGTYQVSYTGDRIARMTNTGA